jgi:integrase/recombinase XerD
MTERAISPLRRRMIEDMTIRKFAQKTQHDYVQRVKDFASYLHRSPDAANPEDVRGFQLHLASSGAGVPKINTTISALRFFFNVTLDRPDSAGTCRPCMSRARACPREGGGSGNLKPQEVARFLEAAPGIKYKAAFSVAYGAGLGVSEVTSLKVCDIDSKRMMLRVEQGKSLPPRRRGVARIATRCLPRRCLNFCATGTASRGRKVGCSRARTQPNCAHTQIAYKSCLMGKFCNGELAGHRAALP